MAILWASGGEEIDFMKSGTAPSVATATGSWVRSGFGRSSVYSPGGSTIIESNSFPGGEITTGWLGWWGYFGNSMGALGRLVGLCKQGTAGKGIYIGTQTSGHYCLVKWDGSTRTLLGAEEPGVSAVVSTGARYDIELVSYGASGRVRLYRNGIQLIDTGSVDNSIGSVNGFDCVCNLNAGGLILGMSEVVVADEDTRNMSLVALAPNAAGDSKVNWTGDYDAIDEITPLNDADVMYSNANDAEAQVNLLPTPTGNFAVKAVVLSARCTKSSDSTPTKIALGVKTGGSVYAGSDIALTTAWETKQVILATNPAGGNWTTAQLDALQLNMKARA